VRQLRRIRAAKEATRGELRLGRREPSDSRRREWVNRSRSDSLERVDVSGNGSGWYPAASSRAIGVPLGLLEEGELIVESDRRRVVCCSSARRSASATIASSFIVSSIVCGLNFARSYSSVNPHADEALTLRLPSTRTRYSSGVSDFSRGTPVGGEGLLHARVSADDSQAWVALRVEVVKALDHGLVEGRSERHMIRSYAAIRAA
jgi:rhodanese-related sulfurtransferase